MSILNIQIPTELADPSLHRLQKPRINGITMIIDNGIGMQEYTDMLQLAAPYIDYLKLGFGTSLLYPESILREKIVLAKEHNIRIYPGGTLTEIAVAQNNIESYFNYIKNIGFTAIELSEGTINVKPEVKLRLIDKAHTLNLDIITEYGKKEEGHRIDIDGMLLQLEDDIANGVSFMIIEGRESGQNVGIYDLNGSIVDTFSHSALAKHHLINSIIWEAPLKKQQAQLISYFGANVNLGNISTKEIIATEALRRGLRSDTFPV